MAEPPGVTRDPGPSSTLPATRRRLLARLVLGLVLIGPAVAIASWACLQQAISSRLRAALDRADRLDPGGWSLQSLLARRARVPADANPASIVEVVLELLPENWPSPSHDAEPGVGFEPDTEFDPLESASQAAPRDVEQLLGAVQQAGALEPLPAEILPLLAAEVDAQAHALRHARELAQSGPGRFPWPGSPLNDGAAFPHLEEVRVVRDLLRLDAACSIERGDPDAALTAAAAVLGLSRAIGDEPNSRSQVVRLSCHAAAVEAIARALARGEPSPDALAEIDLALAEIASAVLRLALDADRAELDLYFSRLEQGNLVALSRGYDPRKPFQSFAMALYRRGQFRFSRALLLERGTTWSILARRSYDSARADWERQFAELDRGPSWFDRLLGSQALSATFDRRTFVGFFVQDLARLRCARAAVALERHRRAQGDWPDSLAALVPGQLRSVPLDPYRNAPLVYEVLPDGVAVYSVGPDGRDDGGKPPAPRDDTRAGTDLGLRLPNPSARPTPSLSPPTFRDPDPFDPDPS